MKKIVTIGGGTGQYVLLKGLKEHDVAISAVVSMADDGGSTGKLREELGVHPAGDVRQCLIALADYPNRISDLFNYRFDGGSLYGHSLGNLLLAGLEKITGNFEDAITEMGALLGSKGKVIPVTVDPIRLGMKLRCGKELCGESQVYLSQEIVDGYESIYLDPHVSANPRAIEAIMDADLVVIGPGGFFTSIIANLLVDGVSHALRETKATRVFVVNLMNRHGQTLGYGVREYVAEIASFLGGDILDYILVNNQKPSPSLWNLYAQEGELVKSNLDDIRVILAPMLGSLGQPCSNDLMPRSPIRHDSAALARQIIQIASPVNQPSALCL